MPKQLIGRAAKALIEESVNRLFDRLKVRLLGPGSVPHGISVSYRQDFSIPGLYEAAIVGDGLRPDKQTLDNILQIAEKYIDSTRATAVAQTLHAVTSFLQNASATGVETDVETVLGGELSQIYTDVSTRVGAIIDTELQTAKNIGCLDALLRINSSQGIDDPVMFFVVVRDGECCKECKRLHLLDDGVTPRAWRLSEIDQGYHKRGQDTPSILGEHPHCRCTPASLLPGYGFKGGAIAFIKNGHDELARQRGLAETE